MLGRLTFALFLFAFSRFLFFILVSFWLLPSPFLRVIIGSVYYVYGVFTAKWT